MRPRTGDLVRGVPEGSVPLCLVRPWSL